MKAKSISLVTPAVHIILLRWAVASFTVLQDVFWLCYAMGLPPLKEVARITVLRRRKVVFLLQLVPPRFQSITNVTVSCSFHIIRAQRNISEISQAANLPGELSLLHSALCSQLKKLLHMHLWEMDGDSRCLLLLLFTTAGNTIH